MLVLLKLNKLPEIMTGRDQIETIKERLDIATVVQEYIPTLKKSGRNHFGLCPFHQEKTPSFSVNSELGLFKCFGCGEGGDVIKFIEKIEGLDFSHALEESAKRAGVELKKFSSPEFKKKREERDTLFELNALVSRYFHYLLTEHKIGEPARKYIQKRKLSRKGISAYQLGFAPPGYENLKKFLLKKGYNENQLVKWGLLATKNGRNYDKFRNRLMFPIIDHQGEVVGFSGRTIDNNDKGPKYLNSPETPVYNKSQLLYGLFQAKESIRKKNFAILVEGNIDIVSSYQAGMQNIVAPLGTALTDQQMTLLKRYCSNIYFAFDTDSAGQKALLKSLDLAERAGLQIKAIDIGNYKDVDELITSGGDWEKIVENAKPVIDFLIKQTAKSYDFNDSKQKAAFSRHILTFIAKIENDIERADYLEKLSHKANVQRDILILQLQKLSQKEGPSNLPDNTKRPVSVFRLNGETYLLSLLLQHPQWLSLAEQLVPAELFQADQNIELFKIIIQEKKIPKELEELYLNIKMSPLKDIFGSKQEFERELKSSANRLRKLYLNRLIRELPTNDDDDSWKELNALSHKLGKVE